VDIKNEHTAQDTSLGPKGKRRSLPQVPVDGNMSLHAFATADPAFQRRISTISISAIGATEPVRYRYQSGRECFADAEFGSRMRLANPTIAYSGNSRCATKIVGSAIRRPQLKKRVDVTTTAENLAPDHR
jgi:hypothetical protein